VANGGSNNVMELRVSDGTVLATYSVAAPGGMTFDGANIWVAGSGTLFKLRTSDGAILGTAPLAVQGLTFDGANIWTAGGSANNVAKVRASDCTVLGIFPAGNAPSDVAFDGTNIWATDTGANSVTEIQASDGAILGTFPVGNSPYGTVFDGTNIWTANGGGDNVTKLRVSDNAILGNFPAGSSPDGIVFDGANIWVADYQGGSVTELRGSDGSTLNTFPVGSMPGQLAFDGANIWVANVGSGTVSKIAALPMPSINPGGVVDAASYTTPVAPGSIASAFGDFLLSSPFGAGQLPLPTSISDLSLQFGNGTLAPLFFVSGGQVNLQVPWELAGQSQTTLTATLNGQVSAVQAVGLAPFAPAIFSTNAEGSGQGAILDTSYLLVDSSNPATAGSSVVLIYCTGLGAVTNKPVTGSAGPSSPLAWSTTPTVMIGGAPADVSFSGLAPGYVGLYQVNAQVPAGSAVGPAVPVMISIGGVESNTVTIAVQ
jgi:uncharacterized protein (TIGR03437 family)